MLRQEVNLYKPFQEPKAAISFFYLASIFADQSDVFLNFSLNGIIFRLGIAQFEK